MRQAKLLVLGTILATLAMTRLSEAAGETYLFIVSGLGGDPEHSDKFDQWSLSMVEAAKSRFELADDHIFYFGEDPERSPEQVSGRSTKENVAGALEALHGRVRPGDQIFILFIGHGSYRDGESRLNLPGPDLTATELGMLLEPFTTQQIVFVNTASASGDFVKALSGSNRIVVTATKSGLQRNETIFGEYFVEAYAHEGADVNKDERISVFEAYEFARQQVSRFYEENNQMKTEHALLDDNGDGVGTHDSTESEQEGDGSRAMSSFLLGGDKARARIPPAEEDPELAALYEQMQSLQERVETLKQQKDAMPPELYMEELEKLLLELAKTNQAIEALESKIDGSAKK